MKKFLKFIELAVSVNLICSCAVFKVSPGIKDSDYKFKELTSVSFSKEIFIKNIDTGNEEKNEYWLDGVDYEKIASNRGLTLSNSSSPYVLVLTIVDASNFIFTTKDFLRSFPYYFWATLSVVSLGIVPTRIHHDIFIKVTVKNISTNRSFDFQERVIYDSWVSIIYAFNGKFKTAQTVLNDAVEPVVLNIFSRIKENIDKKNI